MSTEKKSIFQCSSRHSIPITNGTVFYSLFNIQAFLFSIYSAIRFITKLIFPLTYLWNSPIRCWSHHKWHWRTWFVLWPKRRFASAIDSYSAGEAFLLLVPIMTATSDKQFVCHHFAIVNPFGWHSSIHSPKTERNAWLLHQTLVLLTAKSLYQLQHQPMHSAYTMVEIHQSMVSTWPIMERLSNGSTCRKRLVQRLDKPIYNQVWLLLSVVVASKCNKLKKLKWIESRMWEYIEDL